MRWLQFETLMAGKAPMPEPGFAAALYYQTGGDSAAGRQAVDWALSAAVTDLRQLAIVFDWCQPVLNPAQSKTLAAKIEKIVGSTERLRTVDAFRSRLMASVALADHAPAVSKKQIPAIVNGWWRGEIVPALRAGKNPFSRDDIYALTEFLHAVRDNLNIDLREQVPAYFKDLPIYHLMSHYPATYPAPENEFRIPSQKQIEDPDLTRAAMSRAAELSMVAYDTNAPQTQVLQGWLMHDRFLMRGTLGIVYEFLWANPYQPGLSYYHVPLIFHDDLFGRLFLRATWEDNSTWLGYFDGAVQWFEDGRPSMIRPEVTSAPLVIGDAVVVFGKFAEKFTLTLKEEEAVFVVGLKPKTRYDIEVDDREIYEVSTDPGGILQLKLPAKTTVGIRMRPVG